ncbi:MAG: Uma2 family endonuclease [Oscillospiraceae bacterium]|nr:Uma2 family endonuclease [Oscillospiraceae bacterium]
MLEVRNYDEPIYDDHTKVIKEIIDGKIYYMSGGTSLHEMIIRRLRDEFIKYFIKIGDEKCIVYTEGLDIYLDPKNKKNYVEPDISIICDESKFFKNGYKGEPELIVEVASRDTRARDRGIKYRSYAEYGVKEYWLIEPKFKSIEQYILDNGVYIFRTMVTLFDKDELTEDETKIKSTTFEGLDIDLNKIFKKGDEAFLSIGFDD